MNEDDIYDWAMGNGIIAPYDFSITAEADNVEELAEMGRRWNRHHLEEELRRLKEGQEQIEERLTFLIDQITKTQN